MAADRWGSGSDGGTGGDRRGPAASRPALESGRPVGNVEVRQFDSRSLAHFVRHLFLLIVFLLFFSGCCLSIIYI